MLVLTLREFKVWFEGFSEGIGEKPTKEQWAIIKKKMEEISEQPHHYYWDQLHTRSPLEPIPVNSPYVITCLNDKSKATSLSTSCATPWN